MSKYNQLNEDIIIDIQEDKSIKQKNLINIFVRNTKNENHKISYNTENIKYIKELKIEVKLKSIRFQKYCT